jgi:hypothetical protein
MKSLFHRTFRRLRLCFLAALLVSIALTQPSVAQISELPVAPCAPHNSQQQEDVVILGKLPAAPYIVIVPLRGDEDLLSTVRQCVTDSFQTESRLGKYIQAGAFSQRWAADRLTRQLLALGLDARTIYAP